MPWIVYESTKQAKNCMNEKLKNCKEHGFLSGFKKEYVEAKKIRKESC